MSRLPNVQLIKEAIGQRYPRLGVNQQREVTRLIFEIAKREKEDFLSIIHQLPTEPVRFSAIKKALIKRRFPTTYQRDNSVTYFLPELSINNNDRADVNFNGFRPANIYIEKEVLNSSLAKKLRKRFPQSHFQIIPSYKHYAAQKLYGIKDYNERRSHLFLIKEKYDFYKRCPCGPGSVPCGYYNVGLGMGCPFECAYCYLQYYVNAPGIVIPANLDDFFEAFKKGPKNIRVGSGELTDSLALDSITEFSPKIVDFFRRYPKTIFEFKTKSIDISLLMTVKPADNIVVSWSINPQRVIEDCEYKTPSLSDRLKAALECADYGYHVAFHFDPIIFFRGWQDEYRAVLNKIFKIIDASRISWISLGTLRLVPKMKKIIENRFPENTILDGELILGYDGKLRYHYKCREEIYQFMMANIREYSSDVHVYLCMEGPILWKSCHSQLFKGFS